MTMRLFSTIGALATAAACLAAMPAVAQFSTPYELIKAVEDQNYSEVRTLMLKCRCPNARTMDGVPVLVVASRNGDVPTARYLLENGANPKAAARDTGSTALMEFARRGNLDGVSLLIESGADVDAGDNTGQTALIWAVRGRALRVIKALLESGASVDLPDYQGQTAIDVARNLRYRNIEKILSGEA